MPRFEGMLPEQETRKRLARKSVAAKGTALQIGII
jgi:hypothetical protein